MFEILLTIAAIIVLIILSAFFSGSETALTALSRARIYELERRGDKRALRAARLIAARERLIGALLLGNNLVNILASALATGLFLSHFGDIGVFYATAVMTAVVLVFAEVMPKTYAIARTERMALVVARPVGWVVAVLGPITNTVQYFVRKTLKLFGANIEDDREVLSAHEELRGAIQLHHMEGGVVKDDRDMLGGILDLRNLEVSDVMVHRTSMQSIDADQPSEKIITQVLEAPHTRLPLWRGESDNIIGILHAKDLLRALQASGGKTDEIDIVALTSEPWFVPDTNSVADQLSAFQERKSQFAVVVDEYGEVMGLITLEDILEEIVGEIADEHDDETTGIVKQRDGSIWVEGSLPIRDLNRAMNWDLPDNEATTIAGLVIHEAQTIPETGRAFSFYGFTFEVIKRHRHQLVTLAIRATDA